MKEKGVGVTTNNLNADEKKAVEDAKAKIIAGDIKVPETPEN